MPKGKTRNSAAYIAALLKQLRSDDAPERAAAVADLCTAFEPLVKSLAARYWQPVIGAEQEDLEQVARVGLLEACATYDEAKGAFPTHATWGIRSALARYVGKLANPVRLPTDMAFRLPKLRRIRDQLTLDLQRTPTLEEQSRAIGLPESTTAAMLAYAKGSVPLDAPRGRGDAGSIEWDEPWVESYAAPGLTPEEALIAREEVEALKNVRLEWKKRTG